jgi:hypothetical protein
MKVLFHWPNRWFEVSRRANTHTARMSSRPDSSEFWIIAPPDLSHVAGEEWHNVLESQNEEHEPRGDHSLLYFAYTCVRDLFIGGVIYLAKKIIWWWYFTCKKPENIICDGILHVNTFHYFKIPYFTCNFFTKFTYNEYIGPYFLSRVVLRFSPSDLPETWTPGDRPQHRNTN